MAMYDVLIRNGKIVTADAITEGNVAVKDGRIAEQGNHRELLARRGLYYQMYHAQFEGAEQPL